MAKKPIPRPTESELREHLRYSEEMLERCRGLKIGDEIRFVRMPWYSDNPWFSFHADTRRLYKKLIARRRPTKVSYLDDDGLPWIEYRFRDRHGRMERHSLLVNDDSWELVQKRGK